MCVEMLATIQVIKFVCLFAFVGHASGVFRQKSNAIEFVEKLFARLYLTSCLRVAR